MGAEEHCLSTIVNTQYTWNRHGYRYLKAAVARRRGILLNSVNNGAGLKLICWLSRCSLHCGHLLYRNTLRGISGEYCVIILMIDRGAVLDKKTMQMQSPVQIDK